MKRMRLKRPARLNADALTELMLHLVQDAAKITRVAMMLAGAVILMAADVVVGGLVSRVLIAAEPTQTTNFVAWAFSIGTSGILLALWTFVWSTDRIGLRVFPVLFGIAVTLVDTAVDARLPTLWLYGADVAATSGLVPAQATFVWWLYEILDVLLSLGSDVGLLLVLSVLRREVASAKRARELAIDDAVDTGSTGVPVVPTLVTA